MYRILFKSHKFHINLWDVCQYKVRVGDGGVLGGGVGSNAWIKCLKILHQVTMHIDPLCTLTQNLRNFSLFTGNLRETNVFRTTPKKLPPVGSDLMINESIVK